MRLELFDKQEKLLKTIEGGEDQKAEIVALAKTYGRPVAIRLDGGPHYWTPRGTSEIAHWYGARGGAQPGAGAPKKKPGVKKKRISLQLSPWVVDKLSQLPGSRQAIIEQALLDKFGWQSPE